MARLFKANARDLAITGTVRCFFSECEGVVWWVVGGDGGTPTLLANHPPHPLLKQHD